MTQLDGKDDLVVTSPNDPYQILILSVLEQLFHVAYRFIHKSWKIKSKWMKRVRVLFTHRLTSLQSRKNRPAHPMVLLKVEEEEEEEEKGLRSLRIIIIKARCQ